MDDRCSASVQRQSCAKHVTTFLTLRGANFGDSFHRPNSMHSHKESIPTRAAAKIDIADSQSSLQYCSNNHSWHANATRALCGRGRFTNGRIERVLQSQRPFDASRNAKSLTGPTQYSQQATALLHARFAMIPGVYGRNDLDKTAHWGCCGGGASEGGMPRTFE
jgi:hypothetical protein